MITNNAKYTVLLKSLMENTETKSALNEALSTYPLYQGKKQYDMIPTREELNTKILNHYKYREIGFETIGRFLDELKIAMCEIMPYYNELFKSVEIMGDIKDPFGNVDVTETFEQISKDTTTSEGTTTNIQTATTKQSETTEQSATVSEMGESETKDTVSRDKDLNHRVSDTPQNSVSNINNYLTEHVVDNEQETTTTNGTGKTKNNSTTESEGTATSEGTNTADGTATSEGTSETTRTLQHTFHKTGNQGVNTYAHDMIEYRDVIIDVVNRIIHDNKIAELFMLVW